MKTKILLFGVMVLLLGGCATQRDMYGLEDRLIAVESQNRQLQSQNADLTRQMQSQVENMGKASEVTEKDLRQQYAGMNATLDSLQQEVRSLNGRIEELDYKINHKGTDSENLAKRLDEINLQVSKIEQRQSQLEQYLSIGQTGGKKEVAAAAAAPKGEKAQLTEAQLYQQAKQAYDSGKYDKARQSFQEMLRLYPKSDTADNAQFWIGESYYQENWFEKAILEYQTVIEKYPGGNKVPSAMLKQGLAFLQLGDKSNARLILKELTKKYPQSNEAKIAAQKMAEF